MSGDLSTVSGIGKVADQVWAWKPALHGAVHSAITAFQDKQLTADGIELGFTLQYQARAMLNRLLVGQLAASGDGRIVHIAGNVRNFFRPDLDDLQFEKRSRGFSKWFWVLICLASCISKKPQSAEK